MRRAPVRASSDTRNSCTVVASRTEPTNWRITPKPAGASDRCRAVRAGHRRSAAAGSSCPRRWRPPGPPWRRRRPGSELVQQHPPVGQRVPDTPRRPHSPRRPVCGIAVRGPVTFPRACTRRAAIWQQSAAADAKHGAGHNRGVTDLAALRSACPTVRSSTDRDILAGYRQDWARDPDAGWPIAVVRATCTEDVQAVLRWASEHRVPVVPRGAGSGLSGGSTRRRWRHRAVHGTHARDHDRPGVQGRDHPAGPAQRRGQAGRGRAWAVVSARPVLVRDVLDRRQRGDQCRRAVLRQVRRHDRLRARYAGGTCRRHRASSGRSSAEGRRRAVADENVRRLRAASSACSPS